MLSDIVIAQAAKMLPIAKVAEKLGLTDEDLIPYGRYKAKVNHKLIHSDRPDGKLILVTAISPTPAGEGKTTTSVGLADALNAMGKKTMLCLREPSPWARVRCKGRRCGRRLRLRLCPWKISTCTLPAIFTPLAPQTTCWLP